MSKDSLGVINWWGFTPSINFFDNELLKINESTTDINILLIGCGDSRHILQTISSLYKRERIKINFYVIENGLELYARHFLQIITALIPLSKMGLQDKTELFLELFGNGLVREQSMEFVRQLTDKLIKFVTDPDSFGEAMQVINLENLKFKERDIMEAIFKMWRDNNPKTFDLSLCWDLRIRQNLGTRYDAIPNVFDWDCSITLHDRGAEIINSKEYSHWRHKGVAFRLRDANYDISNRTISSGRVLQTANGDKTVRLGYWGDIVCSPYIPFGIKSSNESLFQKSNNQFIYGASRVSEYNISEIFYQLAYNKKYVETSSSTSGTTITEIDEDIEEEDCCSLDYLNDLIRLPNIRITYLPINSLSDHLMKKTKYESIFDLVYFSTSLIGQLESCSSSPLSKILKSNANVLVESPKFIVNLNQEQNNLYETRIDEMAQNQGLTKCPSEEFQKWGHLLYTFNKSINQ